MKTLIIAAHPDLQNSRINRALADTMREQPNTTVHALYERSNTKF
ncbi:NAD(P)H-dependent oxidoreductase [Paenibacillus sp. S-38]